ncbi:YcdB/YcdC domain-containing protein [Metasolibacillus sp. FSL H7-0170]|uniref:YcdB/YcdC domain-containing protein n=1 Tax=Metasolibacillus sp. FSL H7-0170 TaxID=2921431 RepID=UPI0031580949
MNHQQLKERALCIAKPPKNFQLMFEEVDAQPGGESLFIWGDDQETIKVQLDDAGTITSYFISKEGYKVSVGDEISLEERRQRAEQFLLKYYPNALTDFIFYKVESIDDIEQFYYGQLVMDLPLANAGIMVGLDKAGNLIELMYMGKLPEPKIPHKLVDTTALYENAKRHIRMRLVIAKIAGQLRLIYELDNVYPVYQADILEPVINEQRSTIRYRALPPLVATTTSSLEEILGINSEMQIINATIYNNVKRIVWAKEKVAGLYEDNVHARIDMNTGRLLNITNFKAYQGDLQLSDEEALQKASAFLQLAVPEIYPYLQLEIDENRQPAQFTFRIRTVQNINTHFMVTVIVNYSTGDVESFHCGRIDLEQLQQVSSIPVISAQQAKDIFLAHLDFRLAWGMGNEMGSSILWYDYYDKITGNRLGYIDAIDGTVITFQD